MMRSYPISDHIYKTNVALRHVAVDFFQAGFFFSSEFLSCSEFCGRYVGNSTSTQKLHSVPVAALTISPFFGLIARVLFSTVAPKGAHPCPHNAQQSGFKNKKISAGITKLGGGVFSSSSKKAAPEPLAVGLGIPTKMYISAFTPTNNAVFVSFQETSWENGF